MNSTLPQQYRGLDKATPVRPLSRAESEDLLSLSMADMNGVFKPLREDMAKAMREPGYILIMIKRIEQGIDGQHLDWQDVVDPALMTLIPCLEPKGHMGKCVMWAYTLLLWSTEQKAPVSIDMWCDQYCPFGTPSNAGYQTAWDNQKGFSMGLDKVDNFLDTREAWEGLIKLRLSQLASATPEEAQ